MVTAVDHATTASLLQQRGIDAITVGTKAGSGRARKIVGIAARGISLGHALRRRRPDLLIAVSRSALLGAWMLRRPAFALCDYEYVNLSVGRLTSSYLIHPSVIDAEAFTSRGIRRDRLLPMPALKEALSFDGVDLGSEAPAQLPLSVEPGVSIALVRPPGEQAHYFVPESMDLYRALLEHLSKRTDMAVALAPRYPEQEFVLAEFNWAIPPTVLRQAYPFVSLLKAVDLVISSGGTMAREAAFLGMNSYTILRSEIGQVDRYLESLGRLTIINRASEFALIKPPSGRLFTPLSPVDGGLVDELAGRIPPCVVDGVWSSPASVDILICPRVSGVRAVAPVHESGGNSSPTARGR